MKPKPIASFCALMFAGMLWSAAPAFAAETTTLQSEVRQTDVLTARHGAAPVQARFTSEFTAFAGSEANAQSLVTGLRNGTPITLTSTSSSTTGGTTITSLTFDPPTRPMGNGNVFISLALAKQQLASYGITEPTPQQIQAALTGGMITTGSGATAQTITLKGILTQRADGMGWGAIAKSQGMNLGQVVSGLKRANTQITAGGSTGAGVTTATNAGTQTQATTGTSASVHGNSANAPGHNRGMEGGSGIVTATGSGVGAGLGGGVNAQSGTRASGIVTGSGAAVSARGVVNAQGQAKRLIKQ